MFKPSLSTDSSLETRLRRLPDSTVVFDLSDSWLVVGPTGVAVVAEDCGDLSGACHLAAERADSVRERLAQELAWVPFVDAMCVTDRHDFDPAQPCLVLPEDLLEYTLLDGPTTVDPSALETLQLLPFPVLH